MKGERGEILGIGEFDENGLPVGWIFGPSKTGVALAVDSSVRFVGWTVEELREVYRQREEGER